MVFVPVSFSGFDLFNPFSFVCKDNGQHMKKLRACVGGRRDLAAELQASKRKKNETSESSDVSSARIEPSDRDHSAIAAGEHNSPLLEVHEPVEPVPVVVASASSAAVAGMSPEVINLEGSPEGGPVSPPRPGQPQSKVVRLQTDMVTRAPSTSLGPVRLDHLSVTTPGIQSNWHVNRQAKGLSQVYPYNVGLMAKVGEVGCFEADSIMMARCLALMQYHRGIAEEKVSLRARLADLE